MTPEFLKLYMQAVQSGCETSLGAIVESLGLSGRGLILEQVERASRQLEALELEVVPGLNGGDLDSARILRSKTRKVQDAESLRADLMKGEGPSQEFKQTLFYDINRAAAQPATPLADLKSAHVLHSSLKTIAAMLTCGGGTLQVGVCDTGAISGIERDYPLLRRGAGQDRWELELRDNIEGKFHDGKAINDYVDVRFITVGAVTVGSIQVRGRRRLAYMRDGNDRYLLYRRQGNRSIEVGVHEVEEFINLRREKNLC